MDEHGRPLRAEDLGAGGDRAGRVVDRVHRAHQRRIVTVVGSPRSDRPPFAHPARARRRAGHARGLVGDGALGGRRRDPRARGDSARARRLPDEPRTDGARARGAALAVADEGIELELLAGRRARARAARPARGRRAAPLRARRQRLLAAASSFRTPAGRSGCRSWRRGSPTRTSASCSPTPSATRRCRPARAEPAGVRGRGHAGAADRRLGRRAARAARRETSFAMLDLGLAHLLASDAHAPSIRGDRHVGGGRSDRRRRARTLADRGRARRRSIAGAPLPERPMRARSR